MVRETNALALSAEMVVAARLLGEVIADSWLTVVSDGGLLPPAPLKPHAQIDAAVRGVIDDRRAASLFGMRR